MVSVRLVDDHAIIFFSDAIRSHWDARHSIKQNLSEMGLAHDPNKVLKRPNTKEDMIRKVRGKLEDEEAEVKEEEETSEVVRELEEEVAKMPKRQTFRFSKEEVRWITGMMDRHGDDFKV